MTLTRLFLWYGSIYTLIENVLASEVNERAKKKIEAEVPAQVNARAKQRRHRRQMDETSVSDESWKKNPFHAFKFHFLGVCGRKSFC